jgi:acyl-coenzyme A thioesterase PaaI-like protein
MNVTYFLPPMEGDLVHFESEVLHYTKKLATIRGVMRRDRDGTVLAVRPLVVSLKSKANRVSDLPA